MATAADESGPRAALPESRFRRLVFAAAVTSGLVLGAWSLYLAATGAGTLRDFGATGGRTASCQDAVEEIF